MVLLACSTINLKSFVRPRYRHDTTRWVITEVPICEGVYRCSFLRRFAGRGSRGEGKVAPLRRSTTRSLGADWQVYGLHTSSRMVVYANLSSDGDPDTRSRSPLCIQEDRDATPAESPSRYGTTTRGQTDRRVKPAHSSLDDQPGDVSSANPSDARDASRPNSGDARGASRPNNDDARGASPNDANGASTSRASTRVEHWAQRVGW